MKLLMKVNLAYKYFKLAYKNKNRKQHGMMREQLKKYYPFFNKGDKRL